MSASDHIKKYVQLTEILNSLTQEKRIRWTTTSRDDVFATKIEDRVIEIEIVPGRQGTSDIELSLFNEQGERIDSFLDTTLSDSGWTPNDGNGYTSMLGLHAAARRSATGADDALDQILASLMRGNS